MEDKEEINLMALFDAVYFNRKLVLAFVGLFSLLGGLYVLLAPAVYKADLLIQIEDSSNPANNLLGDVSSLFETKTAASAEIEILQSRMLVSHSVDNLHLDFEAVPRYFPLFGEWLAKRGNVLSGSKSRPLGGYAWGDEQIEVASFKVPAVLEDVKFILTAEGPGSYHLSEPDSGLEVTGQVGRDEVWKTSAGEVQLKVTKLVGRTATEFRLVHRSHLEAVQQLQKKLVVTEKGKQSGILSVELEGYKPALVAAILNELGSQYVRQNTERKSAEAQKTLEFLDGFLPDAKKRLEMAEERFVNLRKERGTVDLTEESKLTLQRSVELRTKEAGLRIKREALLKDLTPMHPAVEAVDAELAAIGKEMAKIEEMVKRLPDVEREVMGLTRDVKLNQEMYTSLMNTAQQLLLVKAGKVGNVRVIDYAAVPEEPIKPNRPLFFGLFVLMGGFFGIFAAFIKHGLSGGIEDPHKIEEETGLSVYASVPVSQKQTALHEKIHAKVKENLILAHQDVHDAAIESLRSFRTALQFGMLDAKNNRVMLSGPTPGVGKSFVSVNFATVMADAGKRILLIDLDLRKGHLNQYLGLPRENGFTDLILGESSPEQVIRKNVIPNLDFISTGVLPPDPNALLLSSRLHGLLDQLSANYDLVIMDTPPVLAVTDATVLSHIAGTIILVTREGTTTLGEVHESIKRFTQVGTAITGILFNGVRQRPTKYGYNSYRYRYSSQAYDSYRQQPNEGREA